MLVLTRKRDECIVITAPDGTRIEVMVVEIGMNKAKIGVVAPDNWTVHREEVQVRIDAQKELNRAPLRRRHHPFPG